MQNAADVYKFSMNFVNFRDEFDEQLSDFHKRTSTPPASCWTNAKFVDFGPPTRGTHRKKEDIFLGGGDVRGGS